MLGAIAFIYWEGGLNDLLKFGVKFRSLPVGTDRQFMGPNVQLVRPQLYSKCDSELIQPHLGEQASVIHLQSLPLD